MSFRAIALPAYLALALGAGWFARLALSPDAKFAVQASRRYDFLERLRLERPDLILVGNSMLYRNVDRALLERLLSVRVGRPIKVFYVSEGATTSAWWYLALKDQIARSGLSGVPVGVMITETQLTQIHTELSARELWVFSKLVQPDDDAFFDKVGRRYRSSMLLYRRLPDRALVSRYILRLWIGAWRPWAPRHDDGGALVAARLDLAEPHPFDLFKAAAPEAKEHGFLSCLEPDLCAEKTLLPDMIRVMKPFRFFIIDSHRPPGTPNGGATPAYREKLGRYLSENGVELISLRGRPELDHAGLWIDPLHVNRAGELLNTRILAEEIGVRRLLR